MAKKWIQGAIKRPGALRAKAERKGLIKPGEQLSKADLLKLEKSGNQTTKRQVALARTLKKLGSRRG